jgi:flavin-dependent dehydrogenase
MSSRPGSPDDEFEVAIVGGGPAGASLAALLAARGRSIVILERRPTWRWRACGVFAGPGVRPYLRALELPDPAAAGVARDIPAMRLETRAGTTLRLAYGADRGGPSALGFDRRALDETLLDLARRAGAQIRPGRSVVEVRLGPRPTVSARGPEGPSTLRAPVVVGADGIRSVVARGAGVARTPRLSRFGLTFHLPTEAGAGGTELTPDARMVVGPDWYCGLAPVPGARVNVGLVLPPGAANSLASAGATATWERIRLSLPEPAPGGVRCRPDGRPLDRPAGASPLGHRVVRRAGPGWLLVGDAAGFVDPFTGEGVHRALASAFLAAEAVDAHLAGDRHALEGYDRAMRARFAAKDAVSLLVAAFLAQPGLFEYAARRLARRASLGRTFEAVLADLTPASRVLSPRFLAALFTP